VLPDVVKSKIIFEINEIDKEFISYRPLFELIKSRDPDSIEMAALSSVLHSFYNGMESIFMLIAKKVDKASPSGDKWHNELLKQMTTGNQYRKEVIDNEIFEILKEYLLFRHYVRHSYKWRLNWKEFRDISLKAENTWSKVKECFLEFISIN
jgi:hypothetical protein